jgi:diaminopimelate decarboxylase
MPLDLLADGAVSITLLAEEIDEYCCEKRVRMLDIGGGLHVNYLSDQSTPTFSDYLEAIVSKLPSWWSLNSSRLILTEFGKSIIAKCGVTAALVEDVLTPPCQSIDQRQKLVAVTHAGADLFLRTAYCPEKFAHRIVLLNENNCIVRGHNFDANNENVFVFEYFSISGSRPR